VLRAENAKPATTLNAPTNPFVCLPFHISASASDIDGAITNLDLLLNDQVIGTFANPGHLNPFTASLNFSYDYPGPAALAIRATDDRGGTSTNTLAMAFITAPEEVITPCGFQPDRTFKMCMLGRPGASYQMLASTNVQTSNWIPIGILENTNGIHRYVDSNATNYVRRYYRAEMQ
jgi:hypothetical protein